MTLSVAMTTRDGARFLPGQLASIASQIERPDELVVGDDGSVDGTVGLLEEFGRRAPFEVRVRTADSARGVVRNMEEVLGEVTGRHIALADQDDIWRADKLRRLRQAAHRVDAALVFSDAAIVDAHDRPVGAGLWSSLDVSRSQIEALVHRPPGPLLRHSCVSGCTMLFTSEVRDLALPFPEVLDDPGGPMLHDRWLALVAASIGPVVAVDDAMVSYRRHERQATGASRDRRVVQVGAALGGGLEPVRLVARARVRQVTALIERLAEREVAVTASVQSQLVDAVEHHAVRAELPARRSARLHAVLDEFRRGGYRRWSRGTTTAVVDVLRPERP